MAKKVLDAKAKQKRQKKIAIGGFVLLLALLAYQGPKTMKLLHPSPPPVSSAAPAPAAATTPVAVGAAVVTPAAAGADALVVNADLSPVPADGQLYVLTKFTSKDPFEPQGVTTTTAAPATTTTPTTTTSSSSTSSDSSFTQAPTSTSTGSTAPTTPAPTVATISVNGVEIAVVVKTDFPADSPFFRLVALTATTAKIGIAGGSLATGSPTVTLKKGKAVTLMNTADGTRYVLVLISMGDATTAASAGSSAAAAGATTPSTGATSPATSTTASH
jgi:hypothetical protein